MFTVSYQFLHSVIDSVAENIVVIDQSGQILFVNQCWNKFAKANDYSATDWQKYNYLEVCHRSALSGDKYALEAIDGISCVLSGEYDEFDFEYPCHSPDKERWFMMRARPFSMKGENHYVISHQDITERYKLEEQTRVMASRDKLTGLFNRHYFESFLNYEWRRCRRLVLPITVAMIDLDYFKRLNDTYGHQTGDRRLSIIGQIINSALQRPTDICGRYGGEEFALVMGDTDQEQSRALIKKIHTVISELKFPNANSSVAPWVTVSIGVFSAVPETDLTPSVLIEKVDRLLYQAKSAGRNCIQYGKEEEMERDGN